MLISNTHREKSDSFIESVQILSCPQLGKFIKKSYIWDPTSGQATRPLAMFNSNSKTLSDARLRDVNFRDVRFDVMLDNSQNIHYYTHDANKNVTELISDFGDISAHYEYSPFGATIASSGDLSYSNPFQFSSEFFDHPLGLIYYNYRHYNLLDGRWINRDPIEEKGGYHLFGMCFNNTIFYWDYLGFFGDGKYGEEGKFPRGHSDFWGFMDPFDYTLEDHDWTTSPFNPKGLPNHFQDRKTSEEKVNNAREICDKDAFERAMHQLQDFWAHYNKGYRPYGGSGWVGHLFDGHEPDNDDKAWQNAEDATKREVKKWHEHCCQTKSGDWIPRKPAETPFPPIVTDTNPDRM